MTKLKLETYARLLANVACRRAVPLGGILAQLGIDAAELHAMETGLREEIAGLWDHRKGVVAMKFAAALGAELARLGPLGDEGAGPTPPAIVPAAPAAPDVRDADLPSYLQPPRTALAMPSVVRTEAPPRSPPVPPQHTPSPLAGTHKMDARDLMAAVERGRLPFVPPDPSKPSAAADATAQARPIVERPASPGVGETMNADLSAIVAAVERGAVPFASPKPPGDEADRPPLPLETYASITRALAHGEPRAEALRKHGLTADAFDNLAKAWAHRLQRDPQLMALFKELANTAPRRGP